MADRMDQYLTELPPRARRILGKDFLGDFFIGTTSACAENTLAYRTARTFIGNYLRVRGEYLPRSITKTHHWELPPRARRIPPPGDYQNPHYGTTSACAENTGQGQTMPQGNRNYLRVRGEYFQAQLIASPSVELPPRARRIPHRYDAGEGCGGTTSACAENTPHRFRSRVQYWNYLRVRGEYSFLPRRGVGWWELPPRARRIQRPGGRGVCGGGNYLRVRGEYTM